MRARLDATDWRILKELQANGRVTNVELARKVGRQSDPLIRQQLAWAYSHVEIMRFNGLRRLAELAGGKEPGPEASTSKLFWSEYEKRLGEIAIDLVGAEALIRPEGEGYKVSHWQDVFLASRAGTIYSGTSQIQKNIISERALGLPREPRLNKTTSAAK